MVFLWEEGESARKSRLRGDDQRVHHDKDAGAQELG